MRFKEAMSLDALVRQATAEAPVSIETILYQAGIDFEYAELDEGEALEISYRSTNGGKPSPRVLMGYRNDMQDRFPLAFALSLIRLGLVPKSERLSVDLGLDCGIDEADRLAALKAAREIVIPEALLIAAYRDGAKTPQALSTQFGVPADVVETRMAECGFASPQGSGHPKSIQSLRQQIDEASSIGDLKSLLHEFLTLIER